MKTIVREGQYVRSRYPYCPIQFEIPYLSMRSCLNSLKTVYPQIDIYDFFANLQALFGKMVISQTFSSYQLADFSFASDNITIRFVPSSKLTHIIEINQSFIFRLDECITKPSHKNRVILSYIGTVNSVLRLNSIKAYYSMQTALQSHLQQDLFSLQIFVQEKLKTQFGRIIFST